MKNYTDLAPSLPWIIPQSPATLGGIIPQASTLGMTLAVGDVDGDSRRELVVVNPANRVLSLISYFEYADVTSEWTAYREPQLVNCFAQPTIGGPKINAPTWIVGQNDLVWCADVDGDGKDEILIFNPDDKWIGLLKWNGSGLECVWQINNQIPSSSGGRNWVISSADQHFVADFDGKGKDEILVFNPEDQWIGVLKWDGSSMGCSWLVGGQIHGSTGRNWVIGSADQHFVTDFDGDGKDEIFIFAPEDQWVGVLKWDGSELQCVWMVGGKIPNSEGNDSYPIGGADQYYVADFDGDGKDELFVFNPVENWIGAFDWSGSAIQWLGGQAEGVPSSKGSDVWSFGSGDQHFVADLDGDGKDEIVVFNPEDQWIGVFQWNGQQMECPWMVGGQIQGNTDSGSWNMALSDHYFVADLNGDGRDELVVINPTDRWAGALRWSDSQIQNIWAVPNCFPFWGMSLLATGPETPFPYSQLPFVETQLTIYEYVSRALASTGNIRSLYPTWDVSGFESMQQSLNQLKNTGYDASEWAAVMVALSQDFVYGYISDTLESGCRGNIRFEYTNGAKTDEDFGNYEGQAKSLAAAPPPPPFNFASSDPYGRYQLFNNVALQIAAECSCVGDVVQLLGKDMYDLAGALRDAQINQLEIVVGNITKTVDATVSNTEWWAGQVVDALLWGAAAISFGDGTYGVNIALSITASMFGSILSSDSGDSGNTPPPPIVDLVEFESELETIYENTLDTNLNALQVVLQDPVKLRLIYNLAQEVWAWPLNFAAEVFSQSAENTYRLYFYQQIIPLSFQMMIWSEVSESQPFYLLIDMGTPLTEYVNAPDDSYLILENSDGMNNIYMLYQGSTNLSHSSNFKYPSSDMMSDLFQTLDVSQSDFFTGANGWNISTVIANVNL
jgi:hypothetical protein